LYAWSKQFSMATVIETFRQGASAEFMCWAFALESQQIRIASNRSQERARVIMPAR
jgi:hypothetical protein